jgi:hypothetical protein
MATARRATTQQDTTTTTMATEVEGIMMVTA